MDQLQPTPLHDFHVAHGGKMVGFAGYALPVQYDGAGVLKEHMHTRTHAALFDVSHMGQAMLRGNIAALEKIVPSDIAGLAAGKTRYTVLLNDAGGIVDDLMVTRIDDNTLYLVVNAACKEKDFSYIKDTIGNDAALDILHDRALLALQGPQAADVLRGMLPVSDRLSFMGHARDGDIYINRGGYTGEDGFEISLPSAQAASFAEKLHTAENVALAGLGARDSLRLEAGLCLYGHDIDDTVTPVEAGLTWAIQKRRRMERNFAGADKIMAQIETGTDKIRVGLKPEGRAPVRENTVLQDAAGNDVGIVTSGGFSPTLGTPVAMGYLPPALRQTGTTVFAFLRGTARPCTVTTLPFVPHKYMKG